MRQALTHLGAHVAGLSGATVDTKRRESEGQRVSAPTIRITVACYRFGQKFTLMRQEHSHHTASTRTPTRTAFQGCKALTVPTSASRVTNVVCTLKRARPKLRAEKSEATQ